MIGGGTEAKINWSLNAKFSENINKTIGTFLDFNSNKIPFDDKFM